MNNSHFCLSYNINVNLSSIKKLTTWEMSRTNYHFDEASQLWHKFERLHEDLTCYYWDHYLSTISESKITLLYLNWILVACRFSWCLSTARGFCRTRGFRAKRKQNVNFPHKNNSSLHTYTWYLHWWHCYLTQMFCTIENKQNAFEQTTRKSKCPSGSWIKPPWRGWFKPANQRMAWRHLFFLTHDFLKTRCQVVLLCRLTYTPLKNLHWSIGSTRNLVCLHICTSSLQFWNTIFICTSAWSSKIPSIRYASFLKHGRLALFSHIYFFTFRDDFRDTTDTNRVPWVPGFTCAVSGVGHVCFVTKYFRPPGAIKTSGTQSTNRDTLVRFPFDQKFRKFWVWERME